MNHKGCLKEKCDFEGVLSEELKLLELLREEGIAEEDGNKSSFERAYASHLCGLALSGGGIRSAIFNLGAIQALSRYGLLEGFDYLSSVSGGGYIGSWLSALLHRKAPKGRTSNAVDQQSVRAFQDCLKPHPETIAKRIDKMESGCFTQDETIGFPPLENNAVRFLRRYSNFLSPRLGLSGDMLAAVSIILRNITLMQLMLISLISAILLFAHGVGLLSDIFASHAVPLYLFTMAMLLFAAWKGGDLMATRRVDPKDRTRAAVPVHSYVILPLFLAAWAGSLALQTGSPLPQLSGYDDASSVVQIVVVALVYLLAGYLGAKARERKSIEIRERLKDRCPDMEEAAQDSRESGTPERAERPSRKKSFFATLVAGLILGGIAYLGALDPNPSSDSWMVAYLGPALALLSLSFVGAIHIGLLGRSISNEDREWLARVGGFILLYSVVWLLLFTLVRYATPFVAWLSVGGWAVLAAWATGSGVGTWFAQGDKTPVSGISGLWKEWITRLAPWLFVLGLTVIVTFFLQWLLFLSPENDDAQMAREFPLLLSIHWEQLKQVPGSVVVIGLLISTGLFFFLSKKIDINLFSLHALYRNRLSRAFIGASNAGDRRPYPFTGFDPCDDVKFSDLCAQRPIPIINTALNMTGGDDLAWQTRRAACFAFTPQWAGYETRSSQGHLLGQYRPTKFYADGLTLGSLMAVSGAAASPNMGYHTSAAVAALLTVFNLRLGRWCGNPAHSTNSNVWKEKSPKTAFQPFIAELTGTANAEAEWINLTDGGHFENLGVYELIRRRCRLIVAIDAGCDPSYQYEDLANMVRKCWTDLGVNIRFDNFKPMYRKADVRFIREHAAIGRIQYNDGPKGEQREGLLLYLKSSMTGDEWPDIRHYADSNEAFPHETTADQFFDENQFEAYRHLGYKVVAKVVETLCAYLNDHPSQMPIDKLIEQLLPKTKAPPCKKQAP